MNRVHVILVALLLAPVGGCVIEPFGRSMPVPPQSWPAQTQPAMVNPPVTNPTLVQTTQPAQTTRHVTTQAVETTRPTPIDRATRDRLGHRVLAEVLRRYPASKDAGLQSYLVLVGSVIALKVPQIAELDFLLLDTDRALSGAIAPRSIFVSRGMVLKMEDESELAGVLAREITNLQSDRALRAAGLTVLPAPELTAMAPATQPATTPSTRQASLPASRPAVTRPVAPGGDAFPAEFQPFVGKIVQILVEGMPSEQEQTADLEGARLAAEARYTPDGFLRLLTRLNPATPSSPIWGRLKALDAAVALISKANPQADVKLPVRFETFVKPRNP